jgi:hypothetical protein
MANTTLLSVRMDPSLRAEIARLAKAEQRSQNAQINVLLREALYYRRQIRESPTSSFSLSSAKSDTAP